MIRKVRDSQRSKVYSSERVIHGNNFQNISHLQSYIDHLVGSAWFRGRWPGIRLVVVMDGRGRKRPCGSHAGLFIKMPRWARYESIALHEVAHVVTADRPAHGRAFVRNFLELVKHKMGVDAWETLKESFKKNNVKWKNREEKKKISPEQLAILRERIAKARKARMEKIETFMKYKKSPEFLARVERLKSISRAIDEVKKEEHKKDQGVLDFQI